MPPRRRGGHAPTWRALQIALLNQIRLDHIFNGARLFAYAGRYIVETHGPAVKAVDQRFEQLSVHHIKALRIHIEHGQRLRGNVLRDGARTFYLSKIAHAAQQAVGYARRASAATRQLHGAARIHGHLQ